MLTKVITQEPDYEIFYKEVNKRRHDDYLNFVPIEMNLQKIIFKLENDFYQTKEHLLHDFRLIESNCKLYNTLNSPISKLSEELVAILIRKLG